MMGRGVQRGMNAEDALDVVGGGLVGAQVEAGLVEFGEHLGEVFFGDGRAVVAEAELRAAPPALDGFGDDAEGLAGDHGLGAELEGVDQVGGIVAVDDDDFPAEGLGLGGEVVGGLGGGDVIGLGDFVAVEDGDDIGELVLGDEVHGFPDLAFAGFAVAHDAVDDCSPVSLRV